MQYTFSFYYCRWRHLLICLSQNPITFCNHTRNFFQISTQIFGTFLFSYLLSYHQTNQINQILNYLDIRLVLCFSFTTFISLLWYSTHFSLYFKSGGLFEMNYPNIDSDWEESHRNTNLEKIWNLPYFVSGSDTDHYIFVVTYLAWQHFRYVLTTRYM